MIFACFAMYDDVICYVFHSSDVTSASLKYVLKNFCCAACSVVKSFISVESFMGTECRNVSTLWCEFQLMVSLFQVDFRKVL